VDNDLLPGLTIAIAGRRNGAAEARADTRVSHAQI
jgi:hypothetical protein